MSNHLFKEYTRSIAFHLTLSQGMIEALRLVRDGASTFGKWDKAKEGLTGMRRSVPNLDALIKRGLIRHDYIEPMKAPKDHEYYKLTRAGELMCELLIEADLMPHAVRRAA